MRQRWESQRAQINGIVNDIISKGQKYSVNEIEQIISSLNMCSRTYNQYIECLNSTEQVNLTRIPSLIQSAQQQLQTYKLEMQREAERSKANIAEQNIRKYLNEAHQSLIRSQFETALALLKKASSESKYIANWNDVSQDLNTKMSKINSSVQILEREIIEFNRRRDANSLLLANDMIAEALRMSTHSDKTLLERHYFRLQNSISTDLKRNWHKFDRDHRPQLFDRISHSISNELIPTSFWKRWAPLNWTNAALYLNRSKLIAPEITAMIDSWVSNRQGAYLELPIFYDNVVPVALVVQAPIHTTEHTDDNSKTQVPSAPLALW